MNAKRRLAPAAAALGAFMALVNVAGHVRSGGAITESTKTFSPAIQTIGASVALAEPAAGRAAQHTGNAQKPESVYNLSRRERQCRRCRGAARQQLGNAAGRFGQPVYTGGLDVRGFMGADPVQLQRHLRPGSGLQSLHLKDRLHCGTANRSGSHLRRRKVRDRLQRERHQWKLQRSPQLRLRSCRQR